MSRPKTLISSTGVSGLAEAVDAPDPLFVHGRVPGQIHVHYHRGRLEIEPDTAGVGREEHAAIGVFT